MTEPFSAKLNLVLKVLSVSRAQLAKELGIDKSVVARWASGATLPSGHNLSHLSNLMARTIPGFTALDWDLDLQSLALRLGVRPSEPGPGQAAAPPLALALPFLDQIEAATGLRGGAYEGFYRSTRPYAAQPGLFLHDHLFARRGDDGLLRFRMSTAGVIVEGWILPIQGQLFIIGTEFTGGTLVFAILHGVNTVQAEVLDGVTLSSNLDAGRTTSATPVVYQRIGDLGPDPAQDNARLDALAAANPVDVAEAIPHDLRRHLLRDLGPEQWAKGGELLLRLPLTQSLSRGPPPVLPGAPPPSS